MIKFMEGLSSGVRRWDVMTDEWDAATSSFVHPVAKLI